MANYTQDVISDLIDGNLPWQITKRIMSDFKDTDRFDKYVSVLQARVPWKEQILLPIGEHLHIVNSGGKRIVKCECGNEFGDYTKNWKLSALIYVRNSGESLDDLYPGAKKFDTTLQELREFICPGCMTILEVEVVPPGYPINFDFLPDLEGFYTKILGRQLP